MQTIDCKLLANAVLLSLELNRFGISKKADIDRVTVDANKDALRLTKRILECPEYQAIVEEQNNTKAWCKARSMPSFIKKGIFCVSKDVVKGMEEVLELSNRKVKEELVPAFIRVYPAAVEQAAKELNGLFNAKDYPAAEVVAAQFGIEWNWLYFAVPDGLPPEIAEQERAKLEKQFKAAEEEVLFALRESFAKLIDHAIDRLSPGPGGKPQRFYDTVITNVTDFIETFSARNLMGDEELKALVDKARMVLDPITPDAVRNNVGLREDIAERFAPIQTVMDTMLEAKPGRKFNFED